MGETLAKQQQELVEKNHNLIYKFAHQNNLSIDDYYDVMAIGLCYAAKAYDESKGAFSTFAYTCMKNELSNYWRSIHARGAIPIEKIVSYDASASEDSSDNEGFLNCFADNSCTCDIATSNVMYESFCNLLTDKEKIIVELLMNSLTHTQIAERMGCSKQNIGHYVYHIRKKMKEYFRNY